MLSLVEAFVGFFSRITIITILNFATFGRQVVDLAVAR